MPSYHVLPIPAKSYIAQISFYSSSSELVVSMFALEDFDLSFLPFLVGMRAVDVVSSDSSMLWPRSRSAALIAGTALTRAAYCSTEREIPWWQSQPPSRRPRHQASAYLLSGKSLAILLVKLSYVDEAHLLELRNPDSSLVRQLYIVHVSYPFASQSQLRDAHLPEGVPIIILAIATSAGRALGLLGDLGRNF